MAFARLFLVLFALLAALPGRAAPAPTPPLKPLTVYFFDVGQGDAALIVSPTGKTVLIDGGPPEADEALVPRLRQLLREPIDLVIMTHPHLDHLGGLVKIIQGVGAKRFMDPGFDHPSESYRKLLEVVGQKVGQVMTPTPNPSAPETLLTVGEGVTLTILWPRTPRDAFLDGTRSDVNANSIVAKLTYGKTAFLFTGDAEPETEAFLLTRPIDFTSTVLKVAHHGGKHSSTAPFLAAVKPQAAVISCGDDYGHPTPEALERLGKTGARIFRTDIQGEVLAVSNGTTVTLTAQKGRSAPVVVTGQTTGPVAKGPMPSGTSGSVGSTRDKVVPASGKLPASSSKGMRYVSLKGTKVFHSEDCRTLEQAKTKERTVYKDRASAEQERRPAKDCDP
ncbi:MBL fold hydrolase [Archangium sp. Cb G35]|uniref:ComEC/Rec2 family competence protein n=1 Tax=Archangium sp. Cb G35 TaxID=1920190 RepID=UPI000937558F|nr:ComEC/Rec2 family competence protein [Archangium sp. Cb G35]OJT27265.1 MBL fold hydrolase [Archangium sp. Cb G35]